MHIAATEGNGSYTCEVRDGDQVLATLSLAHNALDSTMTLAHDGHYRIALTCTWPGQGTLNWIRFYAEKLAPLGESPLAHGRRIITPEAELAKQAWSPKRMALTVWGTMAALGLVGFAVKEYIRRM